MININNIKSYIINLEKDKNKYDLCLKRLQKINLNPPERFDAIYVKDEYDDYIDEAYPEIQVIGQKHSASSVWKLVDEYYLFF